MTYEPFVVTKINGMGQMKREEVNVLGQLIMVKDFDIGTPESPQYQNELTYKYNAQGLVSQIKRRTTDENGEDVIEMLSTSVYDIHGRKTSGSDVDTGYTSTIYNALGEVVQTTDAKGQVLNSYYDSLGRVYKTTSKDHTGNLLTSTTFTYDPVNGLLLDEDKVTYTGGLNLYYGVEHYYDTYNRVSSSTVTFTDTDNLCEDGMSCVYSMGVYYDQFSRVKFQQDASGQAIQNHYNTHGFLSRITKPYVDSKEYYRINSTDHWGNVKSDKRGGSNALSASYFYDAHRGWLTDIVSGVQNHHYEFDVLGNLQSRRKTAVISNETNQLECFSYDRLNRLTRTHRYNPDQVAPSTACTDTNDIIQDEAVSYDGRGNITEKDNELYSYSVANSAAVTVSPHQVRSKGAQVFGYDANGNNTSMTNFIDSSGAYRTRNISYTAFDKIKKVWTTDNNGNEWASSEYRYDIGEDRFYRKDINDQNEASVTHFIGNVEINYPVSGNKVMRRQLGDYAIIIENVGSQSIRYLFTDHLGSVDVITDGSANVLERMSFSAWGEKRVPTTWQSVPPSTLRVLDSSLTTRGFTGHEMNEAFGIINMGGRIYDASLGRVLQADPFVQEPTVSQSYNRYSYVFNNPLSYTDPSGYISRINRIFGRAFGVMLSIFIGPYGYGLTLPVATGIGGFVGALLSTGGDFEAALKAGFTAYATAYLSDKMFAPKASTDTSTASKGGTQEGLGSVGDVSGGTPLELSAPDMGTTTGAVSEQLATQNSNLVGSEVAGNAAGSVGGDSFTVTIQNMKVTGANVIVWETYIDGIINFMSNLFTQDVVVSLGLSGPVNGYRYDMTMQVNYSQLRLMDRIGYDKILGASAMAANYLSVANIVRKISFTAIKNGVKNSFNYLRKFFKGGCNCLVAGTQVLTSEGLVDIKEIEVGDQVWAKDTETGEEGWKEVISLFTNVEKPIYQINLVTDDGEAQIIESTDDHPFYVVGKQWIETKNLVKGDLIETKDGAPVTVVSVELAGRNEITYNFTVEDYHTYYVTEYGVLVHNCWSLQGKSLKWIKNQKPSGWKTVKKNNGKGWKWLDENGNERLIYQRPSGKNAMNSQWSRMENGYFRRLDAKGNFLDVDGNVVLKSDPDFMWKTHIPYEGVH